MNVGQTIAFVMNELTDYSYEISIGAQRVLQAHGYHSVFVTGKRLDDPHNERNNIVYQALTSHRFAGAIFHTYMLEHSAVSNRLNELAAKLPTLPYVAIGGRLHGCPIVTVDNGAGMHHMMDHLLATRGHRRILFVRGLPTNPDSMERERICRTALQRFGCLEQAAFIDGNFDGDIVYRAVYQRLCSGYLPDVIICVNDRMAVAAMDAVQDAGFAVPQDIAVTGFDNSYECQSSKVPLTTVQQPLAEAGMIAANMLLELIAGHLVSDAQIATRLMIRQSCGATSTQLPVAPSSRGAALERTEPLIDPSSSMKRRDYLSYLMTDLTVMLMAATTLDDLIDGLLRSFARLGFCRCTIVLYEQRQSTFAGTARVMLAYDENAPTAWRTADNPSFDSMDLLPPSLLHTIQGSGMSQLKPLVIGTEVYGYIFFGWGTYYFSDYPTLPIIVSCALRNISQLQSLQDYAAHLEQRVEERTRELRVMNQRLQYEIRERQNTERALRLANEKLRHLAEIDGLTQLHNRTSLDQLLQKLCRNQSAAARPLSLLLCDLDYFKNYNDTYGHQAGDDCLRAVAQVLRSLAGKRNGTAARYGGEELVIVLPDCNGEAACQFASTLRDTVTELAIPHRTSDVAAYVTLSIGVVTLSAGESATPEILIDHADEALYYVKMNGRNGHACHRLITLGHSRHGSALQLSLPHPHCLAAG